MISPSTICYALKMTYDFLRSEYLCEKTECNRKRLDEFSDIIDEIDNGKLEIEDYERVQWTRFDVDNPKTFPPDIDEYLVRYSFGKTGIEKWEGKNLGFVSSDRRYITHWLPLPKPPQEEKK